MNIDEAIHGRRSVRIFTEEPVKMEEVRQIIDAGQWGPTATNKQEARFIYIDDEKVISKLYQLGTAHFVNKCKQMILVLYDNRIDNAEYHDDILSAAAAIQNMLLKATQLNIGTCWVANLPSKSALRKLFAIPDYYDPISLIVLGHSAHEPKEVKRKQELSAVLFHNQFDKTKDKASEKSRSKLFVRGMLRKIYIRLPKNRIIKKFAGKYEKKFDN